MKQRKTRNNQHLERKVPHLEVLMGSEELGCPSQEKRNISYSGQGILCMSG